MLTQAIFVGKPRENSRKLEPAKSLRITTHHSSTTPTRVAPSRSCGQERLRFPSFLVFSHGRRALANGTNPTFVVFLNHLNIRKASPQEELTMLIDTQVRVWKV